MLLNQNREKPSLIIIGPSLKVGGIENSSVNIANGFASKGYSVVFIALFRQDKFFELHKEIKFIEPADFNHSRLSLLKSLFWLRSKIKFNTPAKVLVYNYFYGAITRLALCGTNIPVFVSDRASPLYRWPRHIAFFNNLVYRLLPPDGILAQTQLAADYKNDFFKRKIKIKVIPNALRDIQLYPEIVRQKKILAVGRIGDNLKGFDLLIEAFARLRNNEWDLVFAGSEEGSGYLKLQAQNLGVDDRIIFLGKVKEIDKVYAEAGIFVIPSRSEGFPNALCEAMAAGVPCISFDFVAGPRDLISNNKDGLIVPDGDVESMAEQIDYLISSPDKRFVLGRNAMYIREKLEQGRIVNSIAEFIEI
jgi:GalNAc-alpha-(1->4)-GalNAc-alpha-(1->3)-diNAcBac-PP-undecaprenol alpha-1,4-N-acetyl-D-galactosaminyltransferase